MSPEYCRLFAYKKAYKGGVTGTPGPPLATPLIILHFCVTFIEYRLVTVCLAISLESFSFLLSIIICCVVMGLFLMGVILSRTKIAT